MTSAEITNGCILAHQRDCSKKIIYGSPDVTIKYCYDGNQVIAETENDGAATLNRRFFYGPGIDEPICMIDVLDGHAIYYYHYDGLGSVVALSNVNGVLVERYSYDVFGKPTIRDAGGTIISESQVGNPYFFTGRRYDNESGLYYYRARYCSPKIGRFMQTDPIGYKAGLNLYSYVGNNPVNYLDPFGRKKRRHRPDCYEMCNDVHEGMRGSKGCAAKCGKGGSAAVSACLMAANKGYQGCIFGCNLSDDPYDPGPSEAYKRGRDAVYAGCGC